MTCSRLHALRAVAGVALLCLGGPSWNVAQAQFASVAETTSRYAGNSTGSAGYSGDSGTAVGASLNAPSYTVFDSIGNLYVSDTANNCVRKVDTSGNVTTVAGLRVSGGADTCNVTLNAAPTQAQGLLRPTGLAVDSTNRLYIADSLHHCVRSLASGAVDSFAANALTTVAGTCGSVDTASVTPVPNGLALDGSGNLYVSVQDSLAAVPVNQVVRHLAGSSATVACYVAGQASAAVPNACAGMLGAVTLASPAGLTFDMNGNLYIADTGNNCVRELVGMTTPATPVGVCTSDGSGTVNALHNPYGLAFGPSGVLYLSQVGFGGESVVSFSLASGTLARVAGLPSGTAGPYVAGLDGQSAQSAALNAPLGVTVDATGNLYVADSLNNIVRKLSTDTNFAATAVNAQSAVQTVTFAIAQTVSLSATAGPDYTITGNTCTGLLGAVPAPAPPATCQVSLRFAPSRPGARNSALLLKDGLSGKTLGVSLTGVGMGPLSLYTPGVASTIASNVTTAVGIAIDSAGNAYVLEQGNGSTAPAVLQIPAGGGSAVTLIQGNGLQTPTAIALDAAGNIYVADASTAGVTRYGVDGTVNLSYVTGLSTPTAIAVDSYGNVFVAQGGSTHTVIEVYAGGERRVIAGAGTVAGADGVAATGALLVSPSSVAIGPGGVLAIADAGGHRVYTIDGGGVIHLIGGNGTTTSTDTTQALGTALLTPVSVTMDAAGNLYVVDETANRVYVIRSIASSGANIATILGTGVAGYSGDGGAGSSAKVSIPNGIAIDSSGQSITVDAGNNALRQITFPASPMVAFGNVVIGQTSTVQQQGVRNIGNASLLLSTPFTTSDPQFAVSSDPAQTTCGSTVAAGAVCSIGYTFTPAAYGQAVAQSVMTSNNQVSPQTIQLTGFGLFTQALPYTLIAQTEVYGQPFTETANITFNFPNLVPNGTMTYTIAGRTLCSISGPFTTGNTCNAASSGLGVGTYPVIFTYVSTDLSYYSTSGTTTLTISPGTLSVTPANVSKLYGAAIPALPATIVGVVNNDTFLLTDTTTATSTSPVGSYPITPTLTGVALANLNNYTVTYNTGTLTVTPMPLSLTVANASRVYGAANPTFSGTVVGAASGDAFTVTYSTSATASSAAGTYPINATVTGANLGNYSLVVVAGTLTVTQAPLTVTVGNATRVYNTANPAFTSSITGAINGDTFTNTYSTPATIATGVGTYSVTDTLGGAAAGNYSVTVAPGTLTITPSSTPVTVTVAAGATRVYGAANPTFSSTVSGAANGDTFTITYTTSATVASPVGTYTVVPSVSGPAAANYSNITLANGSLTITAAPVTLTVGGASRAYGAANPVFTSAAIPPLVNGDVLTIAYSTTATAASPVGTYPVTATVSGAAAANYAVTVAPGTLRVTQAALTVTVANATRGYGAANPAFSSTLMGVVNGDTFVNSFATSAAAGSAPGTYAITDTVTGANAANYAITVLPGTLTVTPALAPLTVTVTSASRAYGAANPSFASTIVGALNGDTFTVTYSTTATAGSPVGGYPITATVTGTNASSYAITVLPGVLTIVPAVLSVTANSVSRTYGSANPSFSSTITGAVNGDLFSVSYATTAVPGSNVGLYAVVPTVSGPAIGNYTVATNNGTLSVMPAPLTVTAASATRPYGTANPVLTATITGAVNGDTFTSSVSTTATITSPVGTYPITATALGAALSNYTVTSVAGTLTITQATVPLTVTVNSATRAYGTANPIFTGTVTGALNGDTFTVTYATTATSGSPAGTYPITATVGGASAANYSFVVVPGTLTITQAATPLIVTAANVSRLYGAANPVFSSTVTGALNGDTFSVTYSTVATASSPVGTYSIVPTVTGANLSSYVLTALPGTLTVTPAPLTVTVANATRAFGVANPVFAATVAGALNGDTFTSALATTATISSPAGSYPITDVVSGPVGNYAVTNIPGVLTITAAKVALTVTVNSASRVYGAANPAFTSTVAGGLPGDTFTVTYSTIATAGSPVGTYPITASVAGADIAAYTVTVVPGTLTVTAAPLTVTVNNASRAYGAANPIFTSTIVGVQPGDTFTVTYATTATAGSPAGTYPITATVSGANVAAYIVTVVPGTLTVTSTGLSVTVNSAIRAYGAANPTFTSTIVGALPGDTFTVTYATTATASSPVGTYPVTATVTGANIGAYVVTPVAGTLTVTPAGLTVTVNNASRIYGVANPVFTGTVAGLLNGDVVTAAYATTATVSSLPGSYPITATISGAAAGNYAPVIVPGTLAITAIPTATVVSTSAASIQIGVNLTFTATVSSANGTPGGTVNFMNGTALLGTGTLNAAGVATFTTSSLAAGTYTITATYVATPTYAASSGTVGQIITAGSFTLASNPPSAFIRGPGTTVYTITTTSVGNYAGPVNLTCAGLPVDAACSFGSASLTLTAGGTASTTLTLVTTNTDAALALPKVGLHAVDLAPVTAAAVLPFELTGVGALFAGMFRRRANRGMAKSRGRITQLLLVCVATLGMLGLAGCGCFTSNYLNYTVTVTGTSPIAGVSSQTTSVVITVAQQ